MLRPARPLVGLSAWRRACRRAAWGGWLGLLVSAPAGAETKRRFDPESLDLEEPGVLHADLFFGVVRGETAGRWLAPDFDLNLGLASNVVLGLDGAWAIEGTEASLLALDHPAPDNLWFSAKVGFWERTREAKHQAWAVGAQLGPRLALAPGARGAGFQGVMLVGWTHPNLHVVANVGGLVEPGEGVSYGRPAGGLVGLDVSTTLGSSGRWSVAADLSGVVFVSPDRDQLVMTVGPVWAATSWLDLGVNAIAGILSGGDRYGVYAIASPKLSLW